MYGGTVPAELFKRFMLKALEGKEISQFPPAVNGGEIAPWAKAKPEPSPSTSPSCRPGQQNPQPGCTQMTPTVPTTPSLPTGTGEPCINEYNMPIGCDPNLPPDGDKSWWCAKPEHRNDPACKRDDPGGPGAQGA